MIITSSINGTRTFGSAGETAYACTKAAQVALAQMAALELARHKIRVNVICPGRIATEIPQNTQPRHTEAAKVPAEYPAGKIPLTGDGAASRRTSRSWCCSSRRIVPGASPARPCGSTEHNCRWLAEWQR